MDHYQDYEKRLLGVLGIPKNGLIAAKGDPSRDKENRDVQTSYARQVFQGKQVAGSVFAVSAEIGSDGWLCGQRSTAHGNTPRAPIQVDLADFAREGSQI